MSVQTAKVATLSLLLLGVACVALDAPCPCGGRWQDPRASQSQATDLQSTSTLQGMQNIPHTRADHCICHCDGAGDDLYMPPFEKDCAVFAVDCYTPAGKHAKLVCE